MKIRLNNRDIKLIKFIGRYKKIKAVDCKILYKSKDYYRKRLKALEMAGYIKRDKRIIRVGIEGRDILRRLGYENYNICRNKDYQERVDKVIKMALFALGTDMEFKPSWEIKNKEIYTHYGKKYIGELEYNEISKYTVYYISEKNTLKYIKQVITDIEMLVHKDKVIVFLENFKYLDYFNKSFIRDKDSVEIIYPSEQHFEMIQFFEEIDMYDIVKMIYSKKEIYFSNWDKANYMTDDFRYIVCVPFIDVRKLHRLNCLNNSEREIVIDVLTLKENRKKIEEILIYKVNIIELDSWIEEYKKDNEDTYFKL